MNHNGTRKYFLILNSTYIIVEYISVRVLTIQIRISHDLVSFRFFTFPINTSLVKTDLALHVITYKCDHQTYNQYIYHLQTVDVHSDKRRYI
jgi:hypothetical protein